jgi:hypothetical protein
MLATGLDVAREGGDVLYLALEDNERRLQTRMAKLLGPAREWPGALPIRNAMAASGPGRAEWDQRMDQESGEADAGRARRARKLPPAARPRCL